jgi:lycopene cyclase domain-containing protein
MRNFTYLLVNLFIFLPTLVLSFRTDVRPHLHWRAYLAAFLCVCVPFIAWDVWAYNQGHWSFNQEYVTGLELLNLPLEEWLFFVTVPFAMIYVWGVIKKFIPDQPVKILWPLIGFGFVSATAVFWLASYWQNGYTRTVAVITLIAVIILSISRLAYTVRFWVFQLAALVLFIIFNTILTSVPIVQYGTEAIIGTRFITIPLEDFLFNFALLNLFLLAFNYFVTRKQL